MQALWTHFELHVCLPSIFKCMFLITAEKSQVHISLYLLIWIVIISIYRFSRSISSFSHSNSCMCIQIHASAAGRPIRSFKFRIRAIKFIYRHANVCSEQSISFIGKLIFVRGNQIHVCSFNFNFRAPFSRFVNSN